MGGWWLLVVNNCPSIVVVTIPDLLADEAQLLAVALRGPCSKEQLAQKGVQRLLLAPELLVSAAILQLQRAEEPFQHQHGPLLRVGLGGGGGGERRVGDPIGRVLGQRCPAEDEGRSGQGREVAGEG